MFRSKKLNEPSIANSQLFMPKSLYKITVEINDNQLYFYFNLFSPIVPKKNYDQKLSELMNDFMRVYTPDLPIVYTYKEAVDSDDDSDYEDDVLTPNPRVVKNSKSPYIEYRFNETIKAEHIRFLLESLKNTRFRFALPPENFNVDIRGYLPELLPDEPKKNHAKKRVVNPRIRENADGTHSVSPPISIPTPTARR